MGGDTAPVAVVITDSGAVDLVGHVGRACTPPGRSRTGRSRCRDQNPRPRQRDHDDGNELPARSVTGLGHDVLLAVDGRGRLRADGFTIRIRIRLQTGLWEDASLDHRVRERSRA